jgi:hypothetical protein
MGLGDGGLALLGQKPSPVELQNCLTPLAPDPVFGCPNTTETAEKVPQGSLSGADCLFKLLILRSSIDVFEGPKEFFNSFN